MPAHHSVPALPQAIEHGATVAKDDVVWAATATGSVSSNVAGGVRDGCLGAARAAALASDTWPPTVTDSNPAAPF